MESLLIPLASIAMPVAIIWILRHYKLVEKGIIPPTSPILIGGGSVDPKAKERVESLERDKRLLEERVRNLESIVCSVDLELNARLNQLALEARSGRSNLESLPPRATPIQAAGPGASPTLPARPLAEPRGTITPGKVILGRYHIERELGRGGMGAVFLARDAQLGELVALKIISAHLAGEAVAAAERFRREASAARKVTHPNVIRLHDLGEDPETGELFLSMEYFPGMTLAEMLRRRSTLPIDEARDLLKQICDGLEAAHRAGVIHRDLKPGNILVGERGTIKIIDFGLAKASFLAGLTATGLILGTPEYMAPEQIRGRDVDGRTDVYALGAVAYHLVAGAAPFAGDTPIAIGFAHCTQPVRPPIELRPEIGAAMNTAILKALAKEPRDRFQTVTELRSALAT